MSLQWPEELQWTQRQQRELSIRINVGLASTVATFIPVEYGTIRYVSGVTERSRSYRSSVGAEFIVNMENYGRLLLMPSDPREDIGFASSLYADGDFIGVIMHGSILYASGLEISRVVGGEVYLGGCIRTRDVRRRVAHDAKMRVAKVGPEEGPWAGGGRYCHQWR